MRRASRLRLASQSVRGQSRLWTFRLSPTEAKHGYDPLAELAADDDLVGVAYDTFHRFEIHALARHLRRLTVFLVNLQKPGRLAVGLRDRLCAVSSRPLFGPGLERPAHGS